MANVMEDVKSKSLDDILDLTQGMLKLQTAQINTQLRHDIAIPYWRGAPGIAKSSLARAMCAKYNMNFLGTHYSLKPIEEVSGLPTFKDVEINGVVHKGTEWTLPDILTEITELANVKDVNGNTKTTVWLLDDFHLASPAMMQLGYEMFTEWRLRGYNLPPNCAFMLAGNMSAKAGSKKNLTSAVVNRCAIFPVHLDFNYWKRNFAIPNGVNPKIVSFLSNAKYQKYVQEEEQLDRPWASFRSWTRFSTLLNTWEHGVGAMEHHDLFYYAAAHVGDEAAGEFAAYYKIFSEVETTAIFDGKIQIKIPEEFTKQYIYMLACVTEYINRYANDKNKRTENTDVMAQIFCAMARTSSEVGVTGLKEIAVSENNGGKMFKDCYFRVKNAIHMRDDSIAKRLEADIKQI